jgi:hypothetical protein
MLIASLTLLRRPVASIAVKWQTLARIASNPYRPELHYMRGPGPKWHAKQAAAKVVRARPNLPR